MLLKIPLQTLLKKSVLIYTIVLITSCGRNPQQVDVSAIAVKVKAERLEQDLFSSGGQNISMLENKYGNYFDLYCYKLIQTGSPDTVLLKERLLDFTSDADLKEIYGVSESIFHDFSPIEIQLTDALKHYNYYFPQKLIPKIITFISGFNYAIVAADSALGVGVDMYLGSESKFYPALQFPHYKIARMRKEYIAVDCMRGWAQSEWEEDNSQNDLLSQMIYSGKILFFIDAMMPDVPDTIKTGYTASQLKWSNENEKNTWSFFIDQKLLYSSDQNQIIKFLNDGPTTNGFPKESPGSIGQWLGWKIVQAYMKNNSAVTLSQLMSGNDSKRILNDSKYKPGK